MPVDFADGPARVALMNALRAAVLKQTRAQPMSVDNILITLGYFTGAAIGQASHRDSRSATQLREYFIRHLDAGIRDAQVGDKAPSVLLPN